MAMNPNIKQKLLAEILPAVDRVKNDIVDGLEYDTVMDFEYLPKCFYEVLRLEPSVPVSFPANMSKEMTINKVLF